MNFPLMQSHDFCFGVRITLRGTVAVVAGLMAVLAWVGCGSNYRQVENPLTSSAGNPKLQRFAMVVFQQPPLFSSGTMCDFNLSPPCIGATYQIDVSGDTVVTEVYVGRTPVQAVISSQVVVSNQNDDSLSLFALTTSTPSSAGTTPWTVSLPSGSAPTALVIANGAVYVADSGSKQVTVVSPSSNSITATLALPAAPVALAATPDGTEVFVANQDKSVTVISTADNTLLTTIANVTAAVPVAIVADTAGDSVYVLENATPSISIIDVLTNTLLSAKLTLPTGGNSNSMFFDSRLHRLYVTNTGVNSVSVFDASALSSASSPQPPTLMAAVTSQMNGPSAVAALPDGSRAYVVNGGATSGCNGETNKGQVVVINSSSNTVPSSGGCITIYRPPVSVPSSTGPNVGLIAVSGDGSRVYVPYKDNTPSSGEVNPNGVEVINPTTNQVVTEIGAPFTNPDCQTDTQCPGARLTPVSIVSQ
jgi:DNA-binding beta-propeller fold protein YncE